MAQLKPQLMLAGSGRKRSGGWFGYFLTLFIIFVLGVYVGTRVDESEMFSGSFFSWDSGESDNVEEITELEPQSEFHSIKKQSPVKVVDKSENLIITEQDGVAEEVIGAIADSINDADKPATVELNKGGAGIKSEVLKLPGEDSAGEERTSKLVITEEGDDEEIISVGHYTLQIAAFASLDDAERVVSGYVAKGYNAYIVSVTNSRGEMWNLVKIGKFSTIEQAWDQAAIFKSSEGKEAFLENIDRDPAFNESGREGMSSEGSAGLDI